MIVKCIAINDPECYIKRTPEIQQHRGIPSADLLEVGEQYRVLGLSFEEAETGKRCLHFEIEVPVRWITAFPASLFEIVEPEFPRDVELQMISAEEVRIMPRIMMREGFTCEIADEDPVITEEFQSWRRKTYPEDFRTIKRNHRHEPDLDL